ncbi:hypothetical protein [Winogradskyella eximia]|uniref:hypothetical protein n=1 Tax=Winogradskyella eximia TaxID=262006 RepID=UPI0024926C8A|nr:hypothetical protein [Winogradskyella eximia]
MNKRTKTFLIVIAIIVIVFSAFVLNFIMTIAGPINRLNNANKNDLYNIERIRKLPDLFGVIVTDETVINPVSKSSSSLYSLKVGGKQKTSGGGSKGISGSSGFQEYIFHDCIIGYPSDTKLLVDGKLYPINFKKAVLTKVGNKVEEKKGIIVKDYEIYNTTYGYLSIGNSMNYEYYDSIRSVMKQRIKQLKGRHKVIDLYLSDKNHKVDILILREYKFNAGDTIIFKGKIENNEIVPLF